MKVTRCDCCGGEAEGHYPDGDWIAVEANEDSDHGQLCSWACLATWATQRSIEREMAS